MQPLEKSLRNKLERTVMEARDVAEAAARAAVEQLGVGEPKPYAHLSADEKELRRKLRIHGRQLGDFRHAKKETQEIDRLVEEIAYEHWHRMLFARFLAENNLLMYPDPDDPVAVSLEECEDLAAEEGAKNGWELAARFAARMLPQIFRPDSPVFQLELPPEHQQKLERLLAELPEEVFHASDSLGWVYQFWQVKRKDEVNASEVKIGARELPAVTQLFTEPYMVAFLLDNSLGAWWAAKCDAGKGRRGDTGKGIFSRAESEEEIRSACAIPGVPLDYLRFVRVECDSNTPRPHVPASPRLKWTPAAGTFDLPVRGRTQTGGWPEKLAELKTLDPCCGSGHFLVAAFLMLVPMRMELEGLSAREAVDRVLAENIHGLEIDQRCVELAAFALALAAWRYPGAGGYRQLPELNVACSGLSLSAGKDEWKKLANGKQNLRIALDWLHDVFKKAPTLGSILNPAKSEAANLVEWDELEKSLVQALAKEQKDEVREMGVVAHGLARAARMLAGRYRWVITNVPYLARGKQNELLRDFCEKHYPAAKNDLATVFLQRCLELCVEDGTTSLVLPQNWLFLTTYKKFRENLLRNDTWHLVARLGPGAFETITGEVVKAILLIMSHGSSFSESGLFNTGEGVHLIRGIDVSVLSTPSEKANLLREGEFEAIEQAKQLANPDARIALQEAEDFDLLSKWAQGLQGVSPADASRYGRRFWEIRAVSGEWRLWQSTVKETCYHGGKELVLWYGSDLEEAIANGQAYLRGAEAWGRRGLLVRQVGHLPCAIYSGEMFDTNCAVIVSHKPDHLPAIWSFCSSPEYNKAVRQIDQSLKVTNATLVKVPFDLERWTKVAQEKYPNGLPKPYSDDPTQWIFHGHPSGSVIWDEEKKWTAIGPLRTDATVLQVAVARLLGYRWPAEREGTGRRGDAGKMGKEDAGTRGRGDAEMELADEQREWVKRCEELLPFADKDGIVCIPPVRGEAAAADRLLNLLERAYTQVSASPRLPVPASFSAWIQQLLANADHGGKSIDSWLRDKFFAQHCQLFHHRPFIWHIWDGLPDGFAALVNYHKFDHKLLETLVYTYLGDWISRQKQDIAGGVDGAEEKLAAAESLKKKLELILIGEAPYDIFVRWKSLSKQPIGWEPDLNDGVRLNIRPFMTVPDVKKTGAGCLREKPRIHWKKDRGKDVASAPWFELFGGNRINDYHLALEEKRQARAEATRGIGDAGTRRRGEGETR